MFDPINQGQVEVTLGKMSLLVLLIRSSHKLEFETVFIFRGQGSIADIPTELPCSGENQGQFPVEEVLESTDDCVL